MNALTSLGMDTASSSDVSQYIDSATMNVQEKTDTAYMQYMLKTAECGSEYTVKRLAGSVQICNR